MANVVAQFFSIIGPSVDPPTNMQELIPYLLTAFIGIVLVVKANGRRREIRQQAMMSAIG